MYKNVFKVISLVMVIIILGSCGKPTREPDITSHEKYRTQIFVLKAEFREYELPKASFFLF
jgi:hypothetical protein